ncbi:MAG TPA: hypothetical protein VH538_00575 [Gaiellaceae bacterium]
MIETVVELDVAGTEIEPPAGAVGSAVMVKVAVGEVRLVLLVAVTLGDVLPLAPFSV